MIWLILGLALWSGAHLFKRVAPERRARMGDAGKGIIAIALLLSVVLMVVGYRAADFVPLYDPWPWAGHLNNLLVLIAFVLFGVGSTGSWLATRMRHPMLTGVKIWAFAHLLVNGDLASILLFGGLLAWAVVEVIVINRATEWSPDRSRRPGPRDAVLVVAWLVIFAVAAWIHIWLGHNPFLGDYG